MTTSARSSRLTIGATGLAALLTVCGVAEAIATGPEPAGALLRWKFEEGLTLQYRNTLRFENTKRDADGKIESETASTEIEERSFRVTTVHTEDLATIATVLNRVARFKKSYFAATANVPESNTVRKWDSARPELGWEPELDAFTQLEGLEILFTMKSDNVLAFRRRPPETNRQIKELDRKPGLDYEWLIELRVPWEYVVFPREQMQPKDVVETDRFLPFKDGLSGAQNRVRLKFERIEEKDGSRIAWFAISEGWSPGGKGDWAKYPSKPLPDDLWGEQHVLQDEHAGGRLAFDLTHGRLVLFERCSRSGIPWKDGAEKGASAFRSELISVEK